MDTMCQYMYHFLLYGTLEYSVASHSFPSSLGFVYKRQTTPYVIKEYTRIKNPLQLQLIHCRTIYTPSYTDTMMWLQKLRENVFYPTLDLYEGNSRYLVS